METVVRNVDEIDADDRQSLEHVLGQSLRKNQQLVINIVDVQVLTGAVQVPILDSADGTPTLPEWCNVYEGLSDDEIAAIEQAILQRADLSRPSE